MTTNSTSRMRPSRACAHFPVYRVATSDSGKGRWREPAPSSPLAPLALKHLPVCAARALQQAEVASTAFLYKNSVTNHHPPAPAALTADAEETLMAAMGLPTRLKPGSAEASDSYEVGVDEVPLLGRRMHARGSPSAGRGSHHAPPPHSRCAFLVPSLSLQVWGADPAARVPQLSVSTAPPAESARNASNGARRCGTTLLTRRTPR